MIHLIYMKAIESLEKQIETHCGLTEIKFVHKTSVKTESMYFFEPQLSAPPKQSIVHEIQPLI